MKGLRITPLNLGVAGLLVWMFWQIPDAQALFSTRMLLVFLLVLVLLIADQFFRHFIRDIRRIWLIEGAFMLLVLAIASIVVLL